MRKLIISCLLAVLLVVQTISGIAEERFECAGYDTAEEAVLAYIDAFNSGDFSKMLSTFAIESYVDNMDQEYSIKRLGGFYIYNPQFYPITDEYMRSIQIGIRYGDLAENLFNQYLMDTWPPEMLDQVGDPIRMSDDNEVNSFINMVTENNAADWFGNIKFIEFVDVVDVEHILDYENLAERYYHQDYPTKYKERQLLANGGDDLEEVTAKIEINDDEYLLFMECIKYGDHWYNLNLGGAIFTYIGTLAYYAGLMPTEDPYQGT